MISSKRANIIVFLGILFLALNLRAPFTSLAPVLGQIMEDFSLSASAAGVLTALPLLSFAFFSPMAAGISRRFGLYPSMLLALMTISSGIILRSWGDEVPLYLGTVMIGAGIAIGNVLLPVVVKVNFPAKIGVITSLYVFAMGLASTLSASLMVPISKIELIDMSGWQVALLFNLFFPALALTIWLPKIIKNKQNISKKEEVDKGTTVRQLLNCPVAWHVALGIGLNSFTFYSFAGWLPKMLSELGFSEIDAGYIYGFLQFSTMVPGLLLLPILSRVQNVRVLISLCACSVFIAVIGLINMPDFAIFWVALFGLANCSTFIIGMSFVGLRTTSPSQAAALSGLSQSIGYGLTAMGPSLIGYLRALTNTWTVPLLVIAAIALICTIFVNLAARDRKVLQGE